MNNSIASAQPARADRFALTPSVVAAGFVIFAIVWLSELGMTNLTPPVDNIEQLTWVRSLEWGYFKHPPLPTWMIWLPVKAFGLSIWVSYLLGSAMVLGSFAIMWRLLRELRGAAFADVALLAGLCMTCYSKRLYSYNHNTLLLLLSVVTAALLWQACKSGRLRWWIALGLSIGLGALSKYQFALTIISILVFVCHQRAWQDRANRLGMLCASLIALVVFAPHIVWLRAHDFAPISYALGSSLEAALSPATRIQHTLLWVTEQILAHGAPALALLAAAAWQLRKIRKSAKAGPAVHDQVARPHDGARALIIAWGVLPLTIMTLMGLLLGVELKRGWGVAYLIFAAPAAMELAPRGFWDQIELIKLLPVFLAIQAAMLATEFSKSAAGPVPYALHHVKSFDSDAYARAIAGPARATLGGPIRVISGPDPLPSILAIALPERPLVVIDARVDRSPWITPGLIERCGAVELGTVGTVEPLKSPEAYSGFRIDPLGAQPVGPMLPGLWWRVRLPKPGAAPCEAG